MDFRGHMMLLKNSRYIGLAILFQEHEWVLAESFYGETVAIGQGVVLRQYDQKRILGEGNGF